MQFTRTNVISCMMLFRFYPLKRKYYVADKFHPNLITHFGICNGFSMYFTQTIWCCSNRQHAVVLLGFPISTILIRHTGPFSHGKNVKILIFSLFLSPAVRLILPLPFRCVYFTKNANIICC